MQYFTWTKTWAIENSPVRWLGAGTTSIIGDDDS